MAPAASRGSSPALGARLRELRAEAGFDGKGVAALLGRQRSKISRLENGKQTAPPGDLDAWAAAVGRYPRPPT
ncbi:helix-turn-helix domain-containing protein [Streptomyces malaysiensis]|uniref:helix-turn-helix domain-containing protein n=1 Tax=Streptomyces malaysiensis TaxID=92644 RepID=UPI00202FA001|nr:helix-turn-helix transcriptional regulator [Streptomyces malaysiensis]